MDGNFVDNDYDSIIKNARYLPESSALKSDEPLRAGLLGKYDKFRLRLKFSHGLDPNSVNAENARIMSGSRNVKAFIEYDKKKRSIIISPKNKYLRNTLYVLEVSGKIMSENGRSLRENRFFVFKQDGDSLNFYKNVKPEIVKRAPQTLIVLTESVLPALFALSAFILVMSYFMGSTVGLAIGTVMVFVATAAAFIDSISDVGKSRREYVYGAKLYNNGFFFEAIQCFELALHYNPNNHYAKKGLDAAIIKCTEAVD